MRYFVRSLKIQNWDASVMLVHDGEREGIVCEDCTVAAGPLSRMRGLLGRKSLHAGEGILLYPALSIHTAFMRFPIDVVFLSGALKILDVKSDLKPWRTASCRGAKAVVELRAGEVEQRQINVGHRLAIVETSLPANGDLASLVERVGAALDEGDSGDGSWQKVEPLLTEGYAHTLALQAARWQIERRLAVISSSRKASAVFERSSLAERHDEVERDIKWLRALLAELHDHGIALRDYQDQADRRRAA
jgi:uncharacterized membrane protein (UPF0127 family)